ncbi:hypothetical protein ACFWZ4_13340 [Frateuria sp. GZRe12]|uniref:hypothetical protein n=1 Tax=Frateuria sp. GZRe12 TaxID=3351533 RepID=UPI003EDC8535
MFVIMSSLVHQANVMVWLFSLLFMGLYAWGVWSGLRMLEGSPGAVRANFRFWLLQVPAFSSSVIGYFFASGFHLTVTLQWSPLKLNANFLLGSTFTCSLLQADKPLGAGINVFALLIALWLLRQMRRLPPDASPTPMPAPDTA